MGISTPGIGSGLDVNGIVSKLMSVESIPLTQLNNQQSSYQSQISAYGQLSGALSTFQNSLTSLINPATFSALASTQSNSSVLTSTASTTAAAGAYNVTVNQLATAQSLASAGIASQTNSIGTGASTTINFQFGTISSALTGSSLAQSVATSGISSGSLSINGTTIATSASTNSAKALAAQINLLKSTTGVTATAQTTDTGVLSYSDVTTGAGDAYSLTVGNTTIANLGANASFTAADLDTALQSTGAGSIGAQLTADGVSFTGSAVGGNLHFTKADGSNISITQTLTNASTTATGGFTGLTSGTPATYLSGVSLSGSGAINIAGTSPTTAGFTAGSNLNSGAYSGASFTQDPNQTSGTITITSANNSLQGIRDAINAANLGVTATIVSDGSATPYHLVLNSNKTGASSSLKISVTGDSAISGLVGYDPAGTQNLTQTSAAQNAGLTVNGLSITSATNSVSGAIQGVTLNLASAGTSTVSVTRDTSSVQSAISGVVNSYNTLSKAISSLTAYDPTTKTGGPLIGDSAAETIQYQIRQLLTNPIKGSSGTITTLGQVGITFQDDGTLSLDSTKLSDAITNHFSDLTSLFTANGTTTDSLVKFSSSTAASKPGTYQVNVSSLATQGGLTGTATPGLTITAGSNDVLNVNLDGLSGSITIPAGTYTNTTLAAQLQSSINSNTTFSGGGSAVTVTVDSGNHIVVTSNRYGSASKMTVTGDAAAGIFGATPSATTGTDIVGTIGGVNAAGSGQYLTGATGSASEGLKLQITGGSTGARGTVNFAQGYAYQLNNTLSSYLGSSGIIAARTNGVNSEIKDIGKRITDFNSRLADTQKRYLAQFTALDTTIATLQSTQSFLTQQLAQISANSKSG